MQANLIKFITQDILFWSSKGKERTQMRLVLWAYDLCSHSGPYTQKCLKLFLIPAAFILRASLVAQRVKRLPAMRETWVWSLGREDFILGVLMIFEWRSLHFHCARGPESYATSWRQALFCKFLLLRSSFLSTASSLSGHSYQRWPFCSVTLCFGDGLLVQKRTPDSRWVNQSPSRGARVIGPRADTRTKLGQPLGILKTG